MGRTDGWNQRVLKSIITGQPMEKKKPRPKSAAPLETNIQQNCITWFKYQHPSLWNDGVLFHIPNEGIRRGATGKRMKCEGIVRGVADLCLALGRHGYHSLYIEMKRPNNYQSDYQKAWEAGITKHGNKYVVCKSLEEFRDVITWYLNE